jgi:hypothetical protein
VEETMMHRDLNLGGAPHLTLLRYVTEFSYDFAHAGPKGARSGAFWAFWGFMHRLERRDILPRKR